MKIVPIKLLVLVSILTCGLAPPACDLRSGCKRYQKVAPEEASASAPVANIEATRPQRSQTAEPDDYNTLSANQIKRVIKRNVKQMRKCVVKQLKRDPSVTGRLNVVATIKPSGHVSRVRIATHRFRGTVVEKCLKRKIKYWKFPAFDGQSFEARIPLKVAAQY